MLNLHEAEDDASAIELVPADQMNKKNPNAGKPGYDSDGNPDIDPSSGKPEEKDGNDDDESDDGADLD